MAGIIKKKEVGKYDEDWNLIECYDCVAKAAEKNGYSTQTINRRINDGKVKDGFRYKFTGNLIESNFYKNINNKNVKFDVDITTLNMNIWEERICPICGRKFCARKGYKKITCSDYKKLANILWNDTSKIIQSCKMCFSGCTGLDLSKIPTEFGGTATNIINKDTNTTFLKGVSQAQYALNTIKYTGTGKTR